MNSELYQYVNASSTLPISIANCLYQYVDATLDINSELYQYVNAIVDVSNEQYRYVDASCNIVHVSNKLY